MHSLVHISQHLWRAELTTAQHTCMQWYAPVWHMRPAGPWQWSALPAEKGAVSKLYIFSLVKQTVSVSSRVGHRWLSQGCTVLYMPCPACRVELVDGSHKGSECWTDDFVGVMLTYGRMIVCKMDQEDLVGGTAVVHLGDPRGSTPGKTHKPCLHAAMYCAWPTNASCANVRHNCALAFAGCLPGRSLHAMPMQRSR
jgi:hypothetical protein